MCAWRIHAYMIYDGLYNLGGEESWKELDVGLKDLSSH